MNAIAPAVKAAQGQPGNAFDNAIKKNVLLNVEKLKAASPIIDKFVSEKKARVVGAVYQLASGKVELFG